MTLAEAIAQLTRLKEAHGQDTQVYFDCPHCRQAFSPLVVEPVKAVVINGGAPKKP